MQLHGKIFSAFTFTEMRAFQFEPIWSIIYDARQGLRESEAYRKKGTKTE